MERVTRPIKTRLTPEQMQILHDKYGEQEPEAIGDSEFDLVGWMKKHPPPPGVEIRMTVTHPGGREWGGNQVVTAVVWDAYFPWVRGQEIRRLAEELAAEVEREYYNNA